MTKSKKVLGSLAGSLLALASLTACGANQTENAQTLVDNASPSVGCASFESDFYNALYRFPETKSQFPSEQDVKQAFVGKNLSPALTEELTQLYRLLALQTPRVLGQENAIPQELVSTLAGIEIGDQTSPEKEELQQQIAAQFAKVKAVSTSCTKPTSPAIDDVAAGKPKSGTLFAKWRETRPRTIYGALKTMATTYQSCDATQVAAVDNSTQDAIGITIVGKHPDGIGNKRLITNINDLFKTNPFLADYKKPNANCFDVTKNVPIYDYGGKPQTSSGTLNFFVSAGSGTAALGTDCSGYVTSSIATAGLRLKKGVAMKAVTVTGVGATMFTNPQKNGLTCFDYIPLTKTSGMKPGDVIAKAGHVVLVESVGADPFGIAGISNAADCTLANMDVDRFDFTLLQDSPYKGGIGIQRTKASDYMHDPDEVPIHDGMLLAAVVACKAKFGVSGVAKNDKIAITRHSGTAECMNATEIAMDHEACVASCPAL